MKVFSANLSHPDGSNHLLVPFLPVREEFHPKRNQARQKLATLPTTRFEDLSSDVYFELARRYPEFKEDVSYLLPRSLVAASSFLAPFSLPEGVRLYQIMTIILPQTFRQVQFSEAIPTPEPPDVPLQIVTDHRIVVTGEVFPAGDLLKIGAGPAKQSLT